MLTFYYTRNVIRCWIMIYFSKQFNCAYPIYALRTGFLNCWFYFIFLNLKHIEVGIQLYEQVVKVFLMLNNVTIKSSCYKMGQILIKKNPVIFFLKSHFYGCYCSDERFDPKCPFYQKSLENHPLIHELLKVGTFKFQNIVKSFKRSFNSKISGRNIPHEPNRQSGG